jgi:hypothetical protein
MRLPLLFAFVWGQATVGFGMATFFLMMHIPVPEARQSPMFQERIRRYPAWRQKLIFIYPLAAGLVTLLGAAVCVVFVAINAHAGTRPDAPNAYPADFVGAMELATLILAFQAFIILLSFLQWWRGRRAIRKTAREAIQKRQVAAESAG